jgi:tRNA (guanine-N7-)-methyltransferase
MNSEIKDKLWSIVEKKIIESPHLIYIKRGTIVDPSKIFPGKKIFLELGPGWGEVAVELASKNEDFGYLLVEKKINRVKHIIKNINKNNLRNIKIIILNFNWIFEDIFAPNSFDEILLNFPDPWPKLRHRKHRTFNPEFTNNILNLLMPNGRFRFATDHGGYGRSVVRFLRNGSFPSMKDFHFALNRPDLPISYFETIKIKEKSKLYYIEFYKI